MNLLLLLVRRTSCELRELDERDSAAFLLVTSETTKFEPIQSNNCAKPTSINLL